MGKENFSAPDFIKRVKSLDGDAIEELVRAYNLHLFRASLGMGFNETASHELAQSVWGTFMEVAPKFEGRSHIRTFLFGILYNKASEMRRDQKKYDLYDPVEDAMDKRFREDGHWLNHPVSPEKFMIGLQTKEMIEDCLDTVPQTQKMAFYLKEMQGDSTEEICNIMGVSATNLGVLLYRAKNRLRECIEMKSKGK